MPIGMSITRRTRIPASWRRSPPRTGSISRSGEPRGRAARRRTDRLSAQASRPSARQPLDRSMIRRFRDIASREPGSVLAGLFALAFAFYYLASSLAGMLVTALEQHVRQRRAVVQYRPHQVRLWGRGRD